MGRRVREADQYRGVSVLLVDHGPKMRETPSGNLGRGCSRVAAVPDMQSALLAYGAAGGFDIVVADIPPGSGAGLNWPGFSR